MTPPEAQACGFAVILGAPNAGKSTLVNALVGAKISIVSPKVQTTRARVRGIVMEGATQIVLVDTPGIFAPRRKLDEAMVAAAWEGMAGADAVLLLVDAARESAEPDGLAARDTARIIAGLKAAGRRALLVLNKVDAMRRDALLALTSRLTAADIFDEVFMISALTGDGLPALRAAIARRMPAGPWAYPPDQAADLPTRLLAAEITREKLFLRVHQEVPYDLTVETESWREQKDGSVRIEQTILVARDGQKAIVIGKGGQTLKAIGAAAREEMQALFGHAVHLFLHVKVREGWAERPQHWRQMGLDPPRRPGS